MHRYDPNRVVFFSKEDMAGGLQLSKGEKILRNNLSKNLIDINDVLELYHITKYIDNSLYLNNWTKEDIENFKQKSAEYKEVIKLFFSKINDQNFTVNFTNTQRGYIESFWEIIYNLNIYKKISKTIFSETLCNEPFLVHTILKYKYLVSFYENEVRMFLLNDMKSAEILLSIYEVKDNYKEEIKHLPKTLSSDDKEKIISKYLEDEGYNLNYVGLIENAKNRNDFKLSDKIRLKAKRLYQSEVDKFFKENQGIKFGVSISFPKNKAKIKDGNIDVDNQVHYSYSADFIMSNKNPYDLFHHFDLLFEYIDEQKRIELVSKRSRVSTIENIMGVRSDNQYFRDTSFTLSEMISQGQILGYSKILSEMKTSIENLIQYMFTVSFQEKFDFPENAHFSIPISTNSFLEKIRIIAPEFESLLKQYKLYVEDGTIDFELLQISSSPTKIKDIPSLNDGKYIYFNEKNKEMVTCANMFFSDQTILTFVDPYKDKHYTCFFDLLSNEEIIFDNYEEHLKPSLNYLIDKNLIKVDDKGYIQVVNFERLYIFKDLYENDFGSYYHYPITFQKEVLRMKNEEIIFTENSLFSKSEQAYFNYFLNKSEFTNGLDLRNSYLHGTQANPNEVEKHESSYLIYLKLIVLTLLKIEDDLEIKTLRI